MNNLNNVPTKKKTLKDEIIFELIEVVKFIFGFLPWIVFLFLPTKSWEQLIQAMLICAIISIVFSWNALRKGFILQWATSGFFAFSVIALYFFKWIWLAHNMGIIANGILAGMIWFTIIIGKPFTLQYARAELPKERWNDVSLIHASRSIAIFWGLWLLVPTAVSVFKHLEPNGFITDNISFYITLFCILFGAIYTSIFKRIKRKQREKANIGV